MIKTQNKLAFGNSHGLSVIALCLFFASTSIAQEMPPASVKVTKAVEIEMSQSNWLPGTVMGRYDSKIASEVDGRLEEVLDVGDRVTRGDELARIESLTQSLRVTEMQAEILPREARLDFLKREVKRLSMLAENNNAAKSRLDEMSSELRQTEGEIKVARARLAQSRDMLARTVIKAPFDGVISERYKTMGERVESGDHVVRLVNTEDLEIQVRVPPETVSNIGMDNPLQVRDADHAVSKATLRTYVPVGDSVSRLYELRLNFDNRNWMSGHAVRVLVPANTPRKVVAVPRDALVIRQNNISVYRINDEMKSEFVAVKIGMSKDDLVEVIGELNAGETIVIRGNERLRPGQPVTILTEQESE